MWDYHWKQQTVSKTFSSDEMAARAMCGLKDGYYVNLGLGIRPRKLKFSKGPLRVSIHSLKCKSEQSS
jgi:hypothetical protein